MHSFWCRWWWRIPLTFSQQTVAQIEVTRTVLSRSFTGSFFMYLNWITHSGIKILSLLIRQYHTSWIKCRVPGTWHECSTVNITAGIEKNLARDCWRILPATVEHSCQLLLKNYASDCWRIVLGTVEQSCQRLLNNRVSDCWRITPVTVEELCQWLLKNFASDC